MRDRLLPFLLLLTLLDLAFVQATGIVGDGDLLPLWLLAVAAPWLRRLQRWLACRVAWNVGVLLVFTLLVRHATTTGLLHMLEDGLVLAVLCQVHLLNNIGERQRPDLVFFNSLLVAFVTSFFAPDLPWSLLFVIHAFALVAALQVNVLVRRRVPLPPGTVALVVQHALRQTLWLLAVTAALFVLLPRDFARQGWLGDAAGLSVGSEAGVADRIRLDGTLPTRSDDEVVMRLAPAGGQAAEVPSHWRAITFPDFDGIEWSPAAPRRGDFAPGTDIAWQATADGSWQRDVGPPAGIVHVRLPRLGDVRLPLPLAARELRLADGAGILLTAAPGATVRAVRLDDAPGQGLDYAVVLAPGSGRVAPTRRERAELTDLPAQAIPRPLHDLAAQIRRGLPDDTGRLQLAAAAADWLRAHRRYQLPGAPGFARHLGEFLLGAGAGHCEYFAATLAMLLRLHGVPCRLVGGYLAHEWDPATATVVVRARHAHAWVEVLGDDGVWYTLDATPPAAADPGSAAAAWPARAWQRLAELWRAVVGFDADRRADWLQRTLQLPAAFARSALARPFASAAVLLLALLLWFAYRRARRQHEPAIVAFERAVRAAGLTLQDGETPRELLRRAAAAGLDPAPLAALQQAAQSHERLRYGPAATRAGSGVAHP
jgi:hypothetical protein